MTVAIKADTFQDAAAGAPLEDLNPARVDRFQDDAIWPVFERLRREDPVHFTADSEFGPYWSITRFDDIMAVDMDNEGFSSEDGITLLNLEAMAERVKVLGPIQRRGAGFISMDEPEHGVHRKAVSPTLAPSNIANMAPIVRERAGAILDSLPIGVAFDWVDKVSKELTAVTLATLFDFPVRGPEEAHLLVGHDHQRCPVTGRCGTGRTRPKRWANAS